MRCPLFLLQLLLHVNTSHGFCTDWTTARTAAALVSVDETISTPTSPEQQAAATSTQRRHVDDRDSLGRREIPRLLGKNILAITSGLSISLLPSREVDAVSSVITGKHSLTSVTDPSTYSAFVYSKPVSKNSDTKVPLLVILHGAGKNEESAWSLADPNGEHAGLLPSLISTNRAPWEATENFAVVAPYASGKRSFYEEPRSKLLQFVDWVYSEQGQKEGCPTNIDPRRVFLFGFSDGATVAVELATTRRFKACVICAYGFSGILPSLALERLKNIPMWVFHSKDDVIFPVRYSDQLVQSLRSVSASTTSSPGLIRYTRFDKDQEGFTGNVRGHSVGITASKLPDIYTWMLSIP